MRTKRIKYLRSRQRNIRVEAVLAYAQSQAEAEVRAKQIVKVAKLQEMRQKLVERLKSDKTVPESSLVKISTDSKTNSKNIWTDASYPELSSLDSFITQLSKTKVEAT